MQSQIDDDGQRLKLEAKIRELEAENYRLRKELSNLELHTLQFQINPHFIFNTLNAGQQIAMMEGAENTSEFLDKFAKLLRYNIKKINSLVTLDEELDNVKAYAYLLKALYKDWIKVWFNVEQNIPHLNMPSLIFQPLVENAFIHGIGDLEKGGIIEVAVMNIDASVQIIIRDNGKGMNRETIQEILTDKDNFFDDKINDRRTKGIGLKNVIKRLRIFYEREDIIDIHSNSESGTEVIVTLPPR